ncbi:hypothetical protein C8R44DRAFT_876024 [Mycena epipterygia]|nr:hypothetical protein C8R44DRAFT_876024 [Mycena epipterygia]
MKHKHTYSSQPPPLAPSTPCRTPLPALKVLTSPNVTACPPDPVSRDFDVDASTAGAPLTFIIGTANEENHDVSGDATGRIRGDAIPMTGRKDPHDVPPIAFLREQSESVSPISMRAASPLSRPAQAPPAADVRAVHSSVPPASNPSTDTQKPEVQTVDTSNAPSTAPTAKPIPFTFTFGKPAVFAPSSARASTPSARTRAKTGASAHEPAPRYTYPRMFTSDSLIRRRAVPPPPERWQRAGQRELEAACETTQTRVGVLPGPPAFGFGGAAAFVQGMREQEQEAGAGAGREQGGRWWVQPRPNTAPTAAYVALLEDAFGAGSALRGEGAKPEGPKPLGRRVGRGRGGGSPDAGTGWSASASGSTGTGDAMDVDMDDIILPVDIPVPSASRARAWIADIHALVKGKRQLGRTDLEGLAGTMREIADMDAVEGRALGDEGPRLRNSLWQLAQLEDIPFGDEHRLRATARKMVKHWPAT